MTNNVSKSPKKKNKQVVYSLANEIKDILPVNLLCAEEAERNNHLLLNKEYRCVDIYEHCGNMYLAVEVMVRGKMREIYYHESRFELIKGEHQ